MLRVTESSPEGEPFGRYILERPLARGGMAEIFFARHDGPAGFSRHLVIKRILKELASNTEFVEMFLDEARLVAQLSHPNIVQLFDFGEVDGAYFLAMELVPGPNLHGLLKGCAETGIAMPYPIAAKICSGIAEGLEYAQKQTDTAGQPLSIVHRDISPSNILVTYDGVPKILDFGIAKAATQSHKTRTGTIKGKLAYMSPEQVNADPVDGRTDTYALGVVLYRLVTDRRPFHGRSDLELMQRITAGHYIPARDCCADLPPTLDVIIGKAMATDREQRYQTARELSSDLEHFAAEAGGVVTSFDVGGFIERVEEAAGEKLDAIGIPGSSELMSIADCPTERLPKGDGPGAISGITGISDDLPDAREGGTPGDDPITLRSEVVDDEQAGDLEPGLDTPGGGLPIRLIIAITAGSLLLTLLVGGAVQMLSPTSAGGVATEAAAKDEVADSPVAVEAGIPEVGEMGTAQDTAPDAAVVAEPGTRVEKKKGRRKRRRGKKSGPTTPPAEATQPGRVTLLVKPWGVVYVNGAKRGTTPMPPLELAPGRYEIKIVHPDTGKSTTRRVKVTAGAATKLKVDLSL